MRTLDALDSSEIHLWCVFLRELRNESLLAQYRSLLDERERKQELRFYFAHDRRRYVVTRALVRTALSRYADIQPEQWSFAPDIYGRPRVSNVENQAKNLSFNITHTSELVLLGVARDHALGIDAENIRSREPAMDFADLFFAPDEAAALFSLPIDRQQRRFLEYWTLKESYLKARGCGREIPLDKFSFQFPREDRARMSIHPDVDDVADRWRYWQFSLRSRYLVAVCAERVRLESPQLVMKEVIPMVSECELEPLALRVSE
jgi:4'-phosphopantetheinyl transferase